MVDPYLFRPDKELAARYRTMYANTHAFLPERNGITPNTIHVVFDFDTIRVLIVLVALSSHGGFIT